MLTRIVDITTVPLPCFLFLFQDFASTITSKHYLHSNDNEAASLPGACLAEMHGHVTACGWPYPLL